MTQTLQLSWKFFLREFRHGELTLLLLALIIATGSLTSVGFLIKRVDVSMSSHANQLNGAQLILKSSRAVPPQWLEKAASLKIAQAQMQVFPSMLVVNDEFKLAQIKAVSANFPLQGELKVQLLDEANHKIRSVVSKAPPPGEIWLDKRLAVQFNLSSSLQQKAAQKLELGESEFHSTAILERVPGQSKSFISIAPTAMINLSDLAETGTVQAGSRVDYLYFFSTLDGSSEALDQYQQWLQSKLQTGQTLKTGVEDLKSVNASLNKAGDFLSLAAILTVLLSAIAIAINSHRYGQQQYKSSAIMLCLGCSEKRIICIELAKLFILGLIGSLIGIVLGYVAYLGMLSVIDDFLQIDSVTESSQALAFYLLPAWVGLCCGLFLLLTLSMANLSRLRSISPMGLLRKDFLVDKQQNKFFYLLSLVGLILLSIWYTGNVKITLNFYLAFMLSSIILYFIAQLILSGILYFGRHLQLINRLTLLNLQRHKQGVLLQITTFSLIFSLLIVIFLVRTELLQNWQQQFPEQTPNHFVINLQTNERPEFEAYLQQHDIITQGIYPMVRGRLSRLNDIPINDAVSEKSREHNALHRELNLSFMPDLTSKSFKDKAEISIEKGLAKALNIQIGDRLGFNVGSRQIAGQVTELRTVNWDSFQPNFYVIFSPGLIEQYPMTWISSFYLSTEDKIKLNQLMQAFPGITIIEVDELLKEIQLIIERVSDAIELIFIFIIIAGALILSSSLTSTLATRMYENAVIRTLGASAKQLRRYLLVEFIVVALLSAFIAILLSEVAAYVLYQRIFDIAFSLHPEIWLGISLISLLLVCGLGMFVVNKLFTQPADALLKQFSD
ncbi:ABC transporter permease [sulfur-oxidizing endosymbiont of Gigantopelta aegis]|uniref:ABC transporter permease n=1 Tax=sulfur-oxidizing endosymbiont of Gigantopelta aegis TaxID=2794934 RepID=UPI001FE6DF34|nr:FtsX-like permease family protein [sulfur-oxidizing endosymbiont of Gigantopelta aegis]